LDPDPDLDGVGVHGCKELAPMAEARLSASLKKPRGPEGPWLDLPMKTWWLSMKTWWLSIFHIILG